MIIPPVGLDGIRRTVNYGLGTNQTTWNFRSALNVAALNCLDPQYANILPAYSTLLERHSRKLGRTNRDLLASYRAEHGNAAYRSAYDTYMTQVYNYFALPPAQRSFCDTALAIAEESLLVESDQLDMFAQAGLQRLEAVFDDFFRSYETYRVNLAAWDAEYGPPAPAFAPSTYGTTTFGAPTYTTSNGATVQQLPGASASTGQVYTGAVIQPLPGTTTNGANATYNQPGYAAPTYTPPAATVPGQPVVVQRLPDDVVTVGTVPPPAGGLGTIPMDTSMQPAAPPADATSTVRFVEEPVVQGGAAPSQADTAPQPGFGSLTPAQPVDAQGNPIASTSEPVVQQVGPEQDDGGN